MAALMGAILLLTLPAGPAPQRFASSAVRPYGDAESESRAVFATAVGLPPNITMSAAFDDPVGAMLRLSPTFRAQCSRIGRAEQLHVTVRRSLLAPSQSAMTRLVRQDDGRLDAEVEVGPLGDAIMLVAHEFEHIIEQLDGVDLASMAVRPGTGVRSDPKTGQFETERAIAIGQRVARETSRAVARR
jgi:hypothetical protein